MNFEWEHNIAQILILIENKALDSSLNFLIYKCHCANVMHIHGATRKVTCLLEMMAKNITKDTSTLGLILHGEISFLKRIVTKITLNFWNIYFISQIIIIIINKLSNNLTVKFIHLLWCFDHFITLSLSF